MFSHRVGPVLNLEFLKPIQLQIPRIYSIPCMLAVPEPIMSMGDE